MQITQFVTRYLGRCPRCMRHAFIAAALLAASALASWEALGAETPTLALAAITSGATLLWLAHLAAFATRAALRAGNAAKQPTAAIAARVLSRREFGAAFAKAFVAAAAGTALTGAFAGRAFAQVPCDNCEQYSGQERASCCLCKYNNCTAGCGNDNACVNEWIVSPDVVYES